MISDRKVFFFRHTKPQAGISHKASHIRILVGESARLICRHITDIPYHDSRCHRSSSAAVSAALLSGTRIFCPTMSVATARYGLTMLISIHSETRNAIHFFHKKICLRLVSQADFLFIFRNYSAPIRKIAAMQLSFWDILRTSGFTLPCSFNDAFYPSKTSRHAPDPVFSIPSYTLLILNLLPAPLLLKMDLYELTRSDGT